MEEDYENPNLTDFSSPEFSIEEVQRLLYEDGVAVVSNVINVEDCDKYIQEVKEWLQQFGNNFPENFSSLIHQYNIAHLEGIWQARLQTKALFAGLWETQKLLSSMDAIAIGRPPEDGVTKFGAEVTTDNLHFDQGARRQGLHSYQGALYLEEASEEDWCFVVMERSHKLLREFFQEHNPGRSEHRKLTPDEISWLQEHGCTIRRVGVPKGGMVLWDSRTVHAGAPPIQGRKNPSRWRYIFFICQTPAIWATPGDLKLKREAYNNLQISAHWPSQGVRNFEYNKSRYDIMELPPSAKTDEGKRLAGVVPYDFNDGQPNGPKWQPKWSAIKH